MEKEMNLAELSKDISNKLLESQYLIDVIHDIVEGDPKLTTLILLLRKNIMLSFNEIEECRKKIYILD